MSSADQVHEESFSNLPVYLHNLQRTNPGTFTNIKKDGRDCFELCFVALGCLLHTFLATMLPVIFVDCIPLRGKYLRYMFIAVAMDGNHQLLPIAFGLGVRQDVDSWSWFLMRLKECLRDVREVAFINKMSGFIEFALSHVFPDSYRGYCCYNVHKNLQTRIGRSRIVETLFWLTCKSYTMSDFEVNLGRLQIAIENSSRGNTRAWLDNIGRTKWARAFFPNTRFNVKTLGIPDEISMLSAAEHELPITSLIEVIRETVRRMYIERSDLGEGMFGALTPYAATVIERRMNKSVTWEATHICDNIFDVQDFTRSCVVDIRAITCTCGKWRSCGIPCGHVIAALRLLNSLSDCHNFVNIYRTSAVYRVAYQTSPLPPPPPSQWQIPDEMMIVWPPTV